MIYTVDCMDVLPKMEPNVFTSVITDPPYGMSFMSKEWDRSFPKREVWEAILRVTKPGGYLLCFGAPRIYHRVACAIEDAGWLIRDCIMWYYVSGMPKSMNVGKAIDAKLGKERPVIGEKRLGGNALTSTKDKGGTFSVGAKNTPPGYIPITGPGCDESAAFEGYGTGLKPAYEPILVAMKPLDGTFAENALKWGVAGLNVGECKAAERHPANMILEEGEVSAQVDGDVGVLHRAASNEERDKSERVALGPCKTRPAYKGAPKVKGSRIFHCTKATRKEREFGLEDETPEVTTDGRNKPIDNPYLRGKTKRKNIHPTVKPVNLMRYLCRLTKPPPGSDDWVLDPFAGSGSTGIAAESEGRKFCGLEKEAKYASIATKRIDAWRKK